MTRVLVVEDDPDIRNLIVKVLEARGFEVDSAPDGARAWGRIHLELPDIVLMDWMMPTLGGLDLLKACRSDPDFVDLPIVMVTARATQKDLDQGMAAGANAYVTKPFTPTSLVAVINDVLEVSARKERPPA